MCTVLLPLGGYPIAFNKYIKLVHFRKHAGYFRVWTAVHSTYLCTFASPPPPHPLAPHSSYKLRARISLLYLCHTYYNIRPDVRQTETQIQNLSNPKRKIINAIYVNLNNIYRDLDRFIDVSEEPFFH